MTLCCTCKTPLMEMLVTWALSAPVHWSHGLCPPLLVTWALSTPVGHMGSVHPCWSHGLCPPLLVTWALSLTIAVVRSIVAVHLWWLNQAAAIHFSRANLVEVMGKFISPVRFIIPALVTTPPPTILCFWPTEPHPYLKWPLPFLS